MIACLASCGTGQTERLRGAAVRDGIARADAQTQIVLPADCRKIETSGAKKGDRLDEAWVRAEMALDRQNKRVMRCADWYEGTRLPAKKS